MININRKLLISSAIIIFTMMILLIVVFYSNTKIDNSSDNKDSNMSVINNNSNILHYKDRVYFIDNYNIGETNLYKLASLPIDFEFESTNNYIEPTTLVNLGKIQPSRKLQIVEGNIFYFLDGNTYYYNIKENTNKKFCDGQLQYIDNKNLTFISLYNGNLYKGKYYKDSFVTNKLNKLTTSAMDKKHEDDDYLYYCAYMDKNMLLLGFNKEQYIITSYDTINTSNKNLLEVSSTNKYILEILAVSGKQQLVIIDKHTKDKRTIELEDTYDEISFVENTDKKSKNSNDFYLYAKKTKILEDNSEESEYTKYIYTDLDGAFRIFNGSFPGDCIQNYSVIAADNTITLLKQGIEIASINYPLDDFENITLRYIEMIDDYLYYEILLDNNKNTNSTDEEFKPIITRTILARINLSFGESYQINL